MHSAPLPVGPISAETDHSHAPPRLCERRLEGATHVGATIRSATAVAQGSLMGLLGLCRRGAPVSSGSVEELP